MASTEVTVTRMRTEENANNLAAGFLRAVEQAYAGTRLGRQELDGELIEDREDALWTRAGLEAATARWGEAMGDLVEIPEGSEPQDVIVELEEVFHLD